MPDYNILRSLIRKFINEGKGRSVNWKSAYHGTVFPTRSTKHKIKNTGANKTKELPRNLQSWPPDGIPVFITQDYDAAVWYAQRKEIVAGEEYVIELDVHCKNAASEQQLQNVMNDLGIMRSDWDPFADPDPSKTEYTWDSIYRDDVRNELERQGFDGFIGMDPFSNVDIPVIIVWHKSQVRVIGAHTAGDDHDTVKQYTDESGIEKEYDPEIDDWVVTKIPADWSD